MSYLSLSALFEYLCFWFYGHYKYLLQGLIYLMVDYKYRLVVLLTLQTVQTVNPLPAKLFNWNFHPLEVVSR